MNEEELLKMDLQYFAEPAPQDDPADEKPPVDDPKDDDPEGGEDEPTVTVAEMKRRIKKEQEKAQEEIEKAKSEAEKLAKMNADDKERYEREQLEERLAEYERKDQFYSLSKEASKMLAEHDIHADDDVLQFVVGDDADATKASVNAFVELVNAKVEQGVQKALSGRTPKANVNASQAVTKESIMGIKDATERIKAIQANPQLFK